MHADRSLLVTLTGRDRPGVSSALFHTLSDFDVIVLDVEQVTIHGRLTLATLFTAPEAAEEVQLRDALTALARTLSLDCDVVSTDSENQSVAAAVHITVIGSPLKPLALHMIAEVVASCNGNIDRITRMSDWPVTAIELDTSGADPDELRQILTREAISHSVDIAVQRGGLARRAKRLVVMDVDSTLIQNEVIDLLAKQAGVEAEVARITERAMNGEMDFAQSLTERVKYLAGLDEQILKQVRDEIRLTPGAKTLVRTLQMLDHQIGVVSGGFIEVIAPLIEDLGISLVRANSLEINNGRLTGNVRGPIVDRQGKAAALREFSRVVGVPLEQCVAIGDGANDLDMIALAGLGIAFNAKQVVREQANTALSAPYLDSVLYLLGIPRELASQAAQAENSKR